MTPDFGTCSSELQVLSCSSEIMGPVSFLVGRWSCLVEFLGYLERSVIPPPVHLAVLLVCRHNTRWRLAGCSSAESAVFPALFPEVTEDWWAEMTRAGERGKVIHRTLMLKSNVDYEQILPLIH